MRPERSCAKRTDTCCYAFQMRRYYVTYRPSLTASEANALDLATIDNPLSCRSGRGAPSRVGGEGISVADSEPCIFCEIVAGRAPASVVFEDETTLAFLDIRPVTPGHLLVIPKRHAPFLADLDEASGARLFVVAMRLAAALRVSGLECEGVNLFLADGAAAFQEVFHAHLHVFPRFAGDTFRIDADWSVTPAREELDVVAARVRRAQAGE